jgi:hypothetical protein
MKKILFAAALIVAAPAYAQQADPHAGHQGHGQSHEQHKDCCSDKDGNGKMDCCEKMNDGKPMECCAKHAKKTDADSHAGHDMSKQ